MPPATLYEPVMPGTPISRRFGVDGHPGIDYAVPPTSIVVATAAGDVLNASNNDPGGYGLNVRIDHGDGWQSVYGHLSAVYVAAGEHVHALQPLGESGGQPGTANAGRSDGPHLHFEIDVNGTPVDPQPYVQGIPTGRLSGIADQAFAEAFPDGMNSGGVGAPLLGDLGDNPVDDATSAILGPLRDLVTKLPAETLKVLLGGHGPGELAIRAVELVGGALVLAVGVVMVVAVVARSGGEPERASTGARRAARKVTSPARGQLDRLGAAQRPQRSPERPERPRPAERSPAPAKRPRPDPGGPQRHLDDPARLRRESAAYHRRRGS